MFHALHVAEVRRETEDAVSLGLEVPEAVRGVFAFEPGQYLTLRAWIGGEEVRRSYSICSGPGERLRVAVKRVAGGVFSGWVHEGVQDGGVRDGAFQGGGVLEAMAPEGRFVLPRDEGGTVLAAAAGSGITPVLAMLKAGLASGRGRWVLLYGSRSTAEILFRGELEALKDRYMDRFSVVHVLSRERQDIPVLNGRLDAGKLGALLPGLMPEGLPEVALLCGPGDMIDAMGTALRARGMEAGRIRSERFGTGAPTGGASVGRGLVRAAVAAPFAVAAIRADGVSTEVGVGPDETVLEAALRAGLDLPWSCRGGMCSTCRARVTEGAVRMDVNYGLEPWETAAGYVLTCQSRPTTARVVVDYDHV